MHKLLRVSRVTLVVWLGCLSIIGIMLVQVYWLRQAFAAEGREFNQSMFGALTRVAERMARLNNSVLPDRPVTQLTSNYYVVNVNTTIDASVLEHFLKTEFERQHLFTDFEYGIYDCGTDQMMYGNYIALRPSGEGQAAQGHNPAALPKYNKYIYYFGVSIPNRTLYLTGKLDVWVYTTVIMLVVIGFFGYAVYVILQQKRYSEVQRDFINNMTHEFKTPISTINLAADVVAQSLTGERHQRHATIIKRESQRLNELVDHVLEVARHDRDGLTLNAQPLNLNEVLTEAVNGFPLTAKNPEATLELHLPNSDCWALADAFHLKNIVINLLDNAVKYTTRTPVIAVKLSRAGKGQKGQYHLRISDNGIGIPAKFQRQIFDRFFRVPTGNIHNVKGFGLGLHYVQLVARAHRWRVAVESSSEAGTTFLITIPALH